MVVEWWENNNNLVPRILSYPSPRNERVRPLSGLVMCLPESGRLQMNDFGEGQISARFVSL